MKLYLIFFSIILLSCSTCFADVRLVCFYDSLSGNYRSGDGHFTVDNINPHYCTHLVYYNSLLDVNTNSLQIRDQKVDIIDEGFKKFVALKNKNPKLKVLINLKVQRDLRGKYLVMMNNNNSVDTLVTSVLKFFNEFGFDGLHISYLPWLKKETAGFMNLLRALSEAFQPGGYLLGGSGDSSDSAIDLLDNSADIPHLRTYLDYLIVYAYDFHAPYFQPRAADHPSVLYPRPWDSRKDCADYAITHWISKGFPANKIVLAIALYGNSWTIKSNTTTPPVLAYGEGSAGQLTKRSGMLAYYEICHSIKFDGWQVFYDSFQRMGPYAVSPVGDTRTWVGYDDPTMAIVKAKYVLKKNLGGISIRDITLDDFRNVCGEGSNPVITAVSQTLLPVNQITNQTVTSGSNHRSPLSISLIISIHFVFAIAIYA